MEQKSQLSLASRAPSHLKGREIAVPASIANLGPGFDTLAAAVQLYLRLRIHEVSAQDRNRLEFHFTNPLDGDNLIERAFDYLVNENERDFPSLIVDVQSEIPTQAGLGSSAAAIVAGLKLYEMLTGPRSLEELLTIACRIEGHPDNVAAALYGGLTASCQLADGSVIALSTPWPSGVRFVVLTPSVHVQTAEARRVLPAVISRDDAVFNLQRVALLFQSLAKGDYRNLKEALRDRWHQPFRSVLVPGLEKLLALEHPDLLGICLSGSGPSVVALAKRNFAEIELLLSQAYQPVGIRYQVRTLSAHQSELN